MQRVADIKFDDLNELGSTKIIPLEFSLDGIYSTNSTSYQQIARQIILPNLDSIDNYNSLEARLIISYQTEGAATMDVDIFNYTDFVAIAGTEENYPNQSWGFQQGSWFDLSAVAGKALRIRRKRNGGSGLNDVQIEGLSLLVRLKK